MPSIKTENTELGIVAHTFNLSTLEAGLDYTEPQDSKGYIEILSQTNKQKHRLVFTSDYCGCQWTKE